MPGLQEILIDTFGGVVVPLVGAVDEQVDETAASGDLSDVSGELPGHLITNKWVGRIVHTRPQDDGVEGLDRDAREHRIFEPGWAVVALLPGR